MVKGLLKITIWNVCFKHYYKLLFHDNIFTSDDEKSRINDLEQTIF